MRLTRANANRVTRIRAKLIQLPPVEQRRWRALIDAKLATPVGALVGADAPSQSEWDLELANWLDGVYTSVSERAKDLGRGAANAVHETIQAAIPWEVWLFGGAVLIYLLRKR